MISDIPATAIPKLQPSQLTGRLYQSANFPASYRQFLMSTLRVFLEDSLALCQVRVYTFNQTQSFRRTERRRQYLHGRNMPTSHPSSTCKGLRLQPPCLRQTHITLRRSRNYDMQTRGNSSMRNLIQTSNTHRSQTRCHTPRATAINLSSLTRRAQIRNSLRSSQAEAGLTPLLLSAIVLTAYLYPLRITYPSLGPLLDAHQPVRC